MFKKLTNLLACTLLTLPLTSHAGGSVMGATISQVLIAVGPTGTKNLDLAFVYVANSIASSPACSTYNRFVINLSIPSGRVAYATILNAKNNGVPVNVYGTGQCDLYSNSETLSGVEG